MTENSKGGWQFFRYDDSEIYSFNVLNKNNVSDFCSSRGGYVAIILFSDI